MNISDTIIEGTFRQWEEGSVKSVMHIPGTYLTISVYIVYAMGSLHLGTNQVLYLQ